jgi:hypothetical protein
MCATATKPDSPQGYEILRDPTTNYGMAFTAADRKDLGLRVSIKFIPPIPKLT